jgi:O-antigen/teichoic acid export membrane protein
MLLTMGVSLYTSRIVLSTLGVSDYGIYNVVGGLTAMFAFLNNSMSGATSRFLTFELGENNRCKLKKTFSAALTIHLLIAGITFIMGETVGLWFFENKLIIPSERMFAARWVYQSSIFCTVVSIVQIPYNASIIAHERMNVYAYMEILNSLLRLGIVYLLVISNWDKLILYSVLMLCVSATLAMIFKIYCVRNFSESHYKFTWEKNIIYPMICFSGWNLYGTFAYMMKTQGINMFFNLFFGVIVNAAYGIASQVQNAIQGFSNNFITASHPQVIKYYASGELHKMQNLIINVSKFSFLLLLMISLPLIIENQFVLEIWLKNIPDYAVVFCRLNLISGLLTGMFTIFTTAIYATGKIRLWSIVSSTIYLLTVPISYVLLKKGCSPSTPLVINITLLLFGYTSNIFIFRRIVPAFSVSRFFIKVFIICLLISSLSLLLPLYLYYSMDMGWGRFISIVFGSIGMITLSSYFIALNDDLRKMIKKRIKTFVLWK